jgi:rare lipoprotein A
MNKQHLRALCAAFVSTTLSTTLGWSLVGLAETSPAQISPSTSAPTPVSSNSQRDNLQSEVSQTPLAAGSALQDLAQVQGSVQDSVQGSVQDPSESTDVRKVGSPAASSDRPTSPPVQGQAIQVAKVETHRIGERQAATLYVRNIPTLTFLDPAVKPDDAKPENSAEAKTGEAKATEAEVAETKAAAEAQADSGATSTATRKVATDSNAAANALARASALATRLNQLDLATFDAAKIGVKWNEKQSTYVISLADQIWVEIEPKAVVLPDTTSNATQDALQATNRLRRLLGQAPPLKEVANMPKPKPVVVAVASQFSSSAGSSTAARSVASAPVRSRYSGEASWYGPGFNGNLSASGEIFNQYAMTAAHRSLPFGTRVRVINNNSGRSVVVRINDRGPFHGGRIIDLSRGAAEAIGMSGTAYVTLEVLN